MAHAFGVQQPVYLRSKYATEYRAHYQQTGSTAAVCKHATETISDKVEQYCAAKGKDWCSVLLAAACSTVVPYTGVAVMVAYVVVLCLSKSSDLGLIPFSDVLDSDEGKVKCAAELAKNIGANVKNAAKNGTKAAIEAAVFEFLKTFGAEFLWKEVFHSIVVEVLEGVATDSYWILTPLFIPIKYKLHRHLVKNMYKRLGDKAIELHVQWINQKLQ